MGVVLLAAAIWPFVLLAVGLLIGRALRRGDGLAQNRRVMTAGSPGRPRPRRLGSDRPLRATLRGGSGALTSP
jgi:hypothetical protein